MIVCKECQGNGCDPKCPDVACPACEGMGTFSGTPGAPPVGPPCEACDGTGREKLPEEVFCNRCGKTCDKGDINPNLNFPPRHDSYGLIKAKVSGGYHSDSLCDMTTYTFSICEGCLKELFDSFKIPPAVWDDMTGSQEVYNPNWKEDSNRRHEESLARERATLLPLLPETVPDVWEVEANPRGGLCDYYLKGDPGGLHASLSIVCDSLLVSVSRDMVNDDDQPITMEEAEMARQVFAPWAVLDSKLANVRLMLCRGVAEGQLALVGFEKPLGV